MADPRGRATGASYRRGGNRRPGAGSRCARGRNGWGSHGPPPATAARPADGQAARRHGRRRRRSRRPRCHRATARSPGVMSAEPTGPPSSKVMPSRKPRSRTIASSRSHTPVRPQRMKVHAAIHQGSSADGSSITGGVRARRPERGLDSAGLESPPGCVPAAPDDPLDGPAQVVMPRLAVRAARPRQRCQHPHCAPVGTPLIHRPIRRMMRMGRMIRS